MSQARRLRRQQKRTADIAAKAGAKTSQRPPEASTQPPVPHAWLRLAAAFLLPNLGALACGFVFDDRVLIVDNSSLHAASFRQLAHVFRHVWTSGYWPDNRSLGLYRPVSQMLWALIWFAGGSAHPSLFHLAGLALGVAVVLLLYRLLSIVEVPRRVAFIAAALFALFPIHTDATTSVVGSAELLAAGLAIAALIFYYRDQPVPALLLFALAVFSKESAAAFAAIPLVFPRPASHHLLPRYRQFVAAGAAAIIAAALFIHHAIGHGIAGASKIPPIDNPEVLVSAGPRILTALWTQCLYIFKTFVPVTLSADYSYKQIPLVMGLGDWRALAGLLLVAVAVYVAWRMPEFRTPVLIYAILFSPTANILFPIGTIMGERLIYAPSLALALLAAIPIARSRHWKTTLLAVALIFGVRTAVRNLDWLNSERFYTKLAETSPNAAKSHYSIGVLLSSRGDDTAAIEAYDRAIAIYPAYAEAYRNRGNSLARLGRRDEAMASYRQCLRFDPTDFAAASNLQQLQAGLQINPPRAKF